MRDNELLLMMKYLSLCSLKTREYKVILFIFEKLKYDKFVRIKQAKLAEELELTQSDVSKAIKNIEDLEIFEIRKIDRKTEIKLIELDEDKLEEYIEDARYYGF